MTSSNETKYITINTTGKVLIPLTSKSMEIVSTIFDGIVIDTLYDTKDPRTGEQILYDKNETDWPSIKISIMVANPDHIFSSQKEAEEYAEEIRTRDKALGV
jgi:hypothetical protein